MAHLDLEVPDEPPTDYHTHSIISTFYLASRGRKFVSGMSIMPLSLGVADINDVLAAHPVFIDREMLDSCVFALDDIYLSESSEKKEKPKDE